MTPKDVLDEINSILEQGQKGETDKAATLARLEGLKTKIATMIAEDEIDDTVSDFAPEPEPRPENPVLSEPSSSSSSTSSSSGLIR